jgi:hypothetical protein
MGVGVGSELRVETARILQTVGRSIESFPVTSWQQEGQRQALPQNMLPIAFFLFFCCSAGVWTQGLHLRDTPSALFCNGCFQDRVSRTICLGWLLTAILLISAFWVARISAWATGTWFAYCILMHAEKDLQFPGGDRQNAQSKKT